jgi:hypothetical protein
VAAPRLDYYNEIGLLVDLVASEAVRADARDINDDGADVGEL